MRIPWGTSSGKTEVYMRLVEEALKKGGSCLLLIPEISLTPQLEKRFKKGLEKILVHIIQRKPLKRDLMYGKSLSLEN